MKLSVISFLVAGAGLATLQANASPIRVTIASSDGVVPPNFRKGLAGAVPLNPNRDLVATLIPTQPIKKVHHGCAGASLRAKALSFSNAFREALGLPRIEPPHLEAHGGPMRAMPVGTPFIGAPQPQESSNPAKDDQTVHIWTVEHHPHHHPGGFKHQSFARRIHRALMALGPWEGRAVAFVLGCGIGVLLRMVWVMAIVLVRLIRGGSDGEDEFTEFVFEEAEPIVLEVPPPQYTDEKKPEAATTA